MSLNQRSRTIHSESLKHEVRQGCRALVIACVFAFGAGSTFAASLNYIANSSKKVQQVDGPCDWVSWDPKTMYGTPGACGQTASQTIPNEILAHGLGYSFEDTATTNLIFLFGDTVGVKSGVTLSPDPKNGQFLQFFAKDTMARSATKTANEVLSIDFYTQPADSKSPLFVTSGGTESQLPAQPNGMQPSYIPDGTPVAMAGFDIPTSGISLNRQTYLIVQTGAVSTDSGADYSSAYSVLVQFDGVSKFTSGRTISQAQYPTGMKCPVCPQFRPGHFVFTALYEMPLAWSQQLGLSEPAVLIFGNGQFRQSSLYLSYVPVSEFWSGVDAQGNSATRYFAGYQTDGKTPKWSNYEGDARPVVWDNPPSGGPANPDPGTIGNASVTYDSHTNLWLMIYDGGRQIDPATRKPNESTKGIYFTYATAPWGPWQTPQQPIYNACQAHSYGQGYGDLMFYVTSNVSDPNENTCPSALPAGLPPNKPASSGPAGPVIVAGAAGKEVVDPFGQGAFTTRGGPFAPEIIGRFTDVTADHKTLRLFYNISTWNPYTVVEMEADFKIQ